MAHYLTFTLGIISKVTVNDVEVSSGYELQDGDIIKFYTTEMIYTAPIINGTTYAKGVTIDLEDTDIILSAHNSGGSSN